MCSNPSTDFSVLARNSGRREGKKRSGSSFSSRYVRRLSVRRVRMSGFVSESAGTVTVRKKSIPSMTMLVSNSWTICGTRTPFCFFAPECKLSTLLCQQAVVIFTQWDLTHNFNLLSRPYCRGRSSRSDENQLLDTNLQSGEKGSPG